MKYYILCAMLLCTRLCTAQTPSRKIEDPGIYMDKKNPSYNPEKAFLIMRQMAAGGNARAMNGLGIMYTEGLGVKQSKDEAFKWFIKATEGGYDRAWYNLGLAYKSGTGTPQDFDKAFQSFSKGAALQSPFSIYGKGFMLYKGLGCQQSYQEAFKLFYSARAQSVGSCYMLGLCYRNGYGVAVNIDSARYWLEKAMQRGYQQAIDELTSEQPENNAKSSIVSQSPDGTNPKPKNGQFLFKSSLLNANGKLDGSYSGYLIRYDWSGKHVINKSKLTLSLSKKDSLLSGTWDEEGYPGVPLEAILSDSTLVFKSGGFKQNDHYNQRSPNRFTFREAQLYMTRSGDSVLLAGNVQLYSEKLREPEKPVYISLILVETKSVVPPEKTASSAPATVPQIVSGFVAYPNPFNSDLQASFSLNAKSVVKMRLTDVLGRIQYNGKEETLFEGNYIRSIKTSLPAGMYILTLVCNGNYQSAIVIKQ